MEIEVRGDQRRAMLTCGATSGHLVILDHLRWLSASLVAIGHIRSFWMNDYAGQGPVAAAFYYATGFGHQAVMVFFVLSGFLVGRMALAEAAKPRPDVAGYMLDRTSRIFLVLLPALVLATAVSWSVARLCPGGPGLSATWGHVILRPLSGDWAPATWLAAATLTNGLIAPTLAADGPLWSLSYEWAYYVLAIAAACVWRRRWSWVMLYAAGLVALAVVKDPPLLTLGGVWLMGVAASWISDRAIVRGRWPLVGLSAAAVVTFAASRTMQIPDHLLGASIALAIAPDGWRRVALGRRMAKSLASVSFSLYAIHFPLALLLISALGLQHRLPFGVAAVGAVLATFAGVWLCAALFAQVTERQTSRVRAQLARLLQSSGSRSRLWPAFWRLSSSPASTMLPSIVTRADGAPDDSQPLR